MEKTHQFSLTAIAHKHNYVMKCGKEWKNSLKCVIACFLWHIYTLLFFFGHNELAANTNPLILHQMHSM